MGTIIIGTGIIGVSTAYYLSLEHPDPSQIHLIESSSKLFNSASGYAGGFLAKDWFTPAAASLGALSFRLHKELAEENDGAKKWGYAPSTALSLSIDEGVGVGTGVRGEDWLLGGTSRADLASGADKGVLGADGQPAWLTKQTNGSLEVISGEGDCAQVEPRQLSEWMLAQCGERGVQLHMPSTVEKLLQTKDGAIEAVEVKNSEDSGTDFIPCKSLLLAAGVWTPRVFSKLFPNSKVKIPIIPLGGHSLLIRSPRHTHFHEETMKGICHSMFAAPSTKYDWAPEAISRTGGEIFLAGLNTSDKAIPDTADQIEVEKEAINEIKRVGVQLMGLANPQLDKLNEDDLDITRESFCFRPASSSGRPIVCKIGDSRLGKEIKTQSGGGVYIASGHGPWGISMSLGTGRVMAEIMSGIKPSADISRLTL